jgi:redox-sensitive bicupin YhaK (pirin superfamily)
LVGVEAVLDAAADTRLPLQPAWEYAALVLTGAVEVDGLALHPGPLLYLGSGRSDLRLAAEDPSRLLVIGGEPFEEHIVMWWNFVGRDHEDIVTAREDWVRADTRFGTVHGYHGNRLPAPPLPSVRLKPRGRHR